MTTAKYNAFIKGIESGKFNSDKAKIYRMLQNESLTLDMIVLRGINKETASARISDLLDLGVIKSTGQTVSFFLVVTDLNEVKQLQQQRANDVYLNWLKKGKNLGFFTRYVNDIEVNLN